jgi:hypothetical protein
MARKGKQTRRAGPIETHMGDRHGKRKGRRR